MSYLPPPSGPAGAAGGHRPPAGPSWSTPGTVPSVPSIPSTHAYGPPPGSPPPGGGGQPPYGAPPPPGQQPPYGAPGPQGPGGPGGPWGPGDAYAAANYGRGQRAGFGVRLGAYLIDTIIVGLFSLPGYLVFVAGPKEEYRCNSDLSEESFGNFICERPTGSTTALGFLLFAVGLIAGIAYYAILEGRGQTWGKKAVNISTVDARTGAPIGTGRAVGRYFARILSGLPCYLGYLWMLWDDNDQTWHDKLTNSVVVRS